MKSGYSVANQADVALSAGVAKSILGVKSGAAFGVELQAYKISFDGTSASAEPVTVHVCHCTYATNGTPGTNNTDIGSQIVQKYGRVLAHGAGAMANWTTEPTVLSVVEEFLLTPNGGTLPYEIPLLRHPDAGLSEGFVVRCNAPAAVNARAQIEWERI